jgi:ABC-type glycerol-3-phosphate transport system permease component
VQRRIARPDDRTTDATRRRQRIRVRSYDLLLAGTSLATLPIILLFVVLRRQFMAGTAVTGTGIQ